MHVLIAGGTGLIGTALSARLHADGHRVSLLRRGDADGPGPRWDPASGTIDPSALDGVDAVVNLSGASISTIPWTPGRRRRILDSRVAATRTLVAAMHRAATPPAVFVSGSASGYYGSRPGERLDESSTAGTGFLADVCRRWEEQAVRAPSATRTVLARTGVVVHPDAVLRPLIALTKAGVAGPLGRGTQHWPWVSLDDEVAALAFAVTTDALHGPLNITGPTPARADDIMFHLARRLDRPYLLRAPRFALRAALGEAADDLLLSDQLIASDALVSAGFAFSVATAGEAIDRVVPAPDRRG
ncbi:TIGR01777 family protein [Mycetocola reblochoni]|uniref:Cell division inhibitor n=3 Tax=Mycetocola reblochoni TaxID=331618 RepID=A0A1R4K9I4_9MICO|nr:TIGR01777 family oxidoreductase [Mycetocola reblochoni]RLP68106.1 TIGR01777 family protein [Mycetocola reblochoni]SJN40812.1 Cell division inhibitor [Mycetocola reblochoni REB411]